MDPLISPDDYCKVKVTASRSNFAISFRLLTPERRRAITALYAFCREVDDLVDEAEQRATAAQGLAGWRDEVERLYRGEPTHPVTRALLPAIHRYPLRKEEMLALIDGMAMDLEPTRYADFAALERYCYRAASVVGLMAAAIFGYRDPGTLDYAKALGMALQLTNILRDVAEDCRRGRVYLPQDELQQFGVSEAMLCGNEMNASLRALFRFQAERAVGYFELAEQLLPAIDRHHQRSGLVMGAIYRATLEQIIRNDYRVLTGRTSLSTPVKIWLTLRTLWRERRR